MFEEMNPYFSSGCPHCNQMHFQHMCCPMKHCKMHCCPKHCMHFMFQQQTFGTGMIW